MDSEAAPAVEQQALAIERHRLAASGVFRAQKGATPAREKPALANENLDPEVEIPAPASAREALALASLTVSRQLDAPTHRAKGVKSIVAWHEGDSFTGAAGGAMKKTSSLTLIVVLLLGGAAIALLRRPDAPNVPTATKAAPKAPQVAAPPKPAPPSQVANVPVNPTPSPPLPPVAPARESATDQMRAMMARGFINMELRMVVFKSKLTLSDREHERLLDVVMDCRHAEAMVDAPLARRVSFDGVMLVMEVPPHPEQSAAVKTVFGQQLQKDFPPERADEILRALDANLDPLFDGFGKFQQTYTVDKPRDDGQVHVTMTAKVDEARGPADPALIEMARSISGGGWFSRDILDMAHEAIVPAVDKYFPQNATQP